MVPILHRALQGPARFVTLYTDIYWRRRPVNERDGQFESRIPKIKVFRWPFYIHRSIQQQMFQVATFNMLIISDLRCINWLCRLCRKSLFCTAAMQVFSPVSLAFALHMIKIWNRKNRKQPWIAVFSKNRPKLTTNPKMETVTALKHIVPKCLGSEVSK